MPTLIDATEIPGDDLDADAIETAARRVRHVGSRTQRQGRTLVGTWRRLEQHYEAPEDEALLAVMTPVTGHTEVIGSDLAVVARALLAFAAEVRPIATALAALRIEADTFCRTVVGGVEVEKPAVHGVMSRSTVPWNEDIPTVDTNNRLIGRVNDQVELLWAAERRCSNTIRALTGERPLVAGDRPGATKATAYGVGRIDPGTPTDWGAADEPDYSIPDRIVAAGLEVAAESIQGAAEPGGLDLHGGPLDWSWSADRIRDPRPETALALAALAASISSVGPIGTAVARTDSGAGTLVRFQRRRTSLLLSSLTMQAIRAETADPVDFWSRVGWTIASAVVGGPATSGAKAAELGARSGRSVRRASPAARPTAGSAAARIAEGMARRAAHDALEQPSTAERAAALLGLHHPDLAVTSVGPKDLSLKMADHTPSGPRVGADGHSPEPGESSPHQDSHHATTHPDGAKRDGKRIDNRGPDGDPGYPGLRGEAGERELIHARRDRSASAPARDGLEIQPVRGGLIRERNIALSRSEWNAADYFRDRGYNLLAMDKAIPHRGARTADFMIEGIGDMDVYTPAVQPTAPRLFNGVSGKAGQTNFVFIDVDAFDVDPTEIAEALRRIWTDPSTQSIDRVMIVRNHQLIIDARRDPEG